MSTKYFDLVTHENDDNDIKTPLHVQCVAGFLRRGTQLVSIALCCDHIENRPSKATYMPDDSTHIFSNQALCLTQLPERPKAKPPEIFIP